jgi:hypothetical protein
MISRVSDAALTARACKLDQLLARHPFSELRDFKRRFYTWTGSVFSFQPQQPQQQLLNFVGFNVARCVKDSKVCASNFPACFLKLLETWPHRLPPCLYLFHFTNWRRCFLFLIAA